MILDKIKTQKFNFINFSRGSQQNSIGDSSVSACYYMQKISYENVRYRAYTLSVTDTPLRIQYAFWRK